MPFVSIILCTNKPGHVMAGIPDMHHLHYTIQNAIKRQDFKQFELIIADCLPDRNFMWSSIKNVHFPIYHVVADHNPPTLQAARNAGLAIASGDFMVFLRDCCNFESMFLDKVIGIWEKTGTFVSPLWIKETGHREERIPGGGLVRDARFEKLADNNLFIDDFELGDYFTCSTEAALSVGGFDETASAVEFGEALKKAGYHLSINRKVVVKEQTFNMQDGVKAFPEPHRFDFHKLRETMMNLRYDYMVVEPNSLTKNSFLR